jgi:DNA topoisomerase I
MASALLDTCPVARRLAQKRSSTPVSLDAPGQAARVAGLRYVSDAMPGIRRRRVGRHFIYLGVDRRPIRDPAELCRIKALVIPPAWTDLWICPIAEGHLQAMGRDASR